MAKKQNYLHGAAIMTATTFIVKIFGFLYKIPLGSMNLLGDEGYAHFLVAYNIYSFFLTLATAGFPVALSRMISVADTLERPAQVQRVFTVAASLLAAIGGIFSLVMLIFHRSLAHLMGDAGASLAIISLAPAVLVVCLTSAYRGYCQGRKNMIPTSFGQVIEEFGKLVVGLTLAFLLVRSGHDLSEAAAGAIFGVTAGASAALIFMILYKRRNYHFDPAAATDTPESKRHIFREFLRIAIPIAIGSSVLSLVNLLDNSLCLNRLQSAAGFSSSEANVLYGAYGKAQMFYNLPSYFITPLTLTVVPAVAAEIAKHNPDEAGTIAESSLRMCAVIALPISVVLCLLSDPIFNVLYWGSNAAGPELLRWLAPAAFFVCMAMICNAVLQANGHEKLPIISIAVGGAVKIAVNWVLVGNPAINIHGAPIGSICCFAVICLLDYIFLCRTMTRRPRLTRIFLAPFAASAAAGLASLAVYRLIYSLVFHGHMARGTMGVSFLVAVIVAVAVYCVMLGVTRAVTMEDMYLIPKGEKLGRLLHLRQSPR